MTTDQLLLRLPVELVRRFRRAVPVRKRSRFVRHLLERALPPEDSDDGPLYRAALEVERNSRLAGEMDEWETATIDDRLTEPDPPRPER